MTMTTVFITKKKFYVATQDFEMIELYGATAMEIIIPENIRFLGGELGHSNLYFMKDYKNVGGWIPFYEDIIF